MGIRLGISGTGDFANAFIPIFKAHPMVEEVVLADLVPERVEKAKRDYGITKSAASHEALCESDVDAIAIFTQRHLHGPMAIEALEAGKHVYCAVPMASEIQHIENIIRLVKETKLVYMTGETSYYYPSTLYCRARFEKGDFGRFVYGEGNYFHDMSHGFYDAFRHSGGENWKQVAGIPPMFYPTHSTSHVLSVTGARGVEVYCTGYKDQNEDGIFKKGGNLWDNEFSNQTALIQTSDGGMMRINEFRRVGWYGSSSSNPMCIYGTQGSFEENSQSQVWTSLEPNEMEDVSELLDCYRHYSPAAAGDDAHLHQVLQRDFNSQFAKIQPSYRLPEEFAAVRNGHLGSHQFLVDDFCKAVDGGLLPHTNAWASANYCAPGLVAYQSCLENKPLPIPDFGELPDWEALEQDKIL